MFQHNLFYCFKTNFKRLWGGNFFLIGKRTFFVVFFCAVLINGGFAKNVFADVGNIGKGNATEVYERMAPVMRRKMAGQGLKLGANIYIRIFKESHELELWVQNTEKQYELFTTFPICNYSGNLGPKQKQGDMQAPEGFYSISPYSLNPWSRRHLAVNIGYPNRYDRKLGRTGSALMIHGNCTSKGCFAITDAGMEEFYTIVEAAMKSGQKDISIHIFPFRMTHENIGKHLKSVWIDFWLALKPGYDFFERFHVMPKIDVKEKKYVVMFDAV